MKRIALLALLAVAACSGKRERAPATPPPAPPPSAQGVDMPVNRLANATVYDSQGQASACEPPERDCSKLERDPDFVDRCRLAGFQVRQCGCRMVCAGQATPRAEYYDASGSNKPCAPEAADCNPPETSARFQDACEESGHKLTVCGCEWLCNGKPKGL